MRFSGVLLLVLALGHFFIMHVVNSIHQIDYDFVAQRYFQWFWRAYDLAMLWLAMLHGANGARTLLDDYLRPPARGWAVKALYLGGALFLFLGTWVILFFKPL
ncbi:MAG: succinate dehydrogenase [Candidatus Omnitrophica bacterium]|nr:succinate dehydrogenase [Candidatus Omnitrophota bacterium]